nr:uncharacterized protein LOC113716003 [Coffea arabica]
MAITICSGKVLDDPGVKIKPVLEKKNKVKVGDRSENFEDEHDGLGKEGEDDQHIKLLEVKADVPPILFSQRFKKKAIDEMKLKFANLVPTQVILQLADHSVHYPMGIVEDLLVKVGQLYFPIDFIVLDIEEDISIPIILARRASNKIDNRTIQFSFSFMVSKLLLLGPLLVNLHY